MKQLYIALIVFHFLVTTLGAEQERSSFMPTWKLMNPLEKRQFLAGYLYGWKDAGHITGIASGFVRENPDRAIETLDEISKLYELSGLKPEILVERVDYFFSDPDNRNASLSSAISAARVAVPE